MKILIPTAALFALATMLAGVHAERSSSQIAGALLYVLIWIVGGWGVMTALAHLAPTNSFGVPTATGIAMTVVGCVAGLTGVAGACVQVARMLP